MVRKGNRKETENEFEEEEDRGVEVCGHADGRIKERLGVKSEHKRLALAKLAYERGLRERDCDGYALEYLRMKRKTVPECEGRELVLYCGKIFVFSGETLVTVYLPPEGYARLIRKETARKKCRARVRTYALDDPAFAA